MTTLKFILLTASTVAALHIPEPFTTARINERTSPVLTSDDSRYATHPLGLVKRTDPTLGSGDFGSNFEGDSKRDWLVESFPDVYNLALSAVNRFDSRIFNNYFPPKDEDGVKAVFSAVVKSTVYITPFLSTD